MQLNGSGFYQLSGDQLLYAPNFVENKDFRLYADRHEQYNYPVEGWYWFDDEEKARTFFGLPLTEEPTSTVPTPDNPQPIVKEISSPDDSTIDGYVVYYPKGSLPPSLTGLLNQTP